MPETKPPHARRAFWMVLPILIVLGTALRGQAQAPQIDVQGPPGAPESRGRLGPAPGASGTSAFESPQFSGPIGGRAGTSVSRAFAGSFNPSATRPMATSEAMFKLPVLEPAEVPRYGAIEIPEGPEDIGPEDGLSLDGAISRLIGQNLTLMALRFEIPMAEADVLTAGLRNNPIFYADSQLIPYGHFSNSRPGGQTQYDVNITLQLDIWRKRRARMDVAERAKRVTEAQFQDAVRNTIDNLYTVYVDVVAADETLRYSRAYSKGISEVLEVNLQRLRAGSITAATTDALRSQVEQAELQVHEAEQALAKATRRLALLLNLSAAEAASIQVRSALGDFHPLPATTEALVAQALNTRPDLAAYRLGLSRAQADARLAKANRYSDVYLLVQPFTFQDNRPLGFQSSYSYAVGATVALPVFNRNQGNIRRAQLNQRQSQIELAALERQVIYDVEDGVREFEVSLNAANELKNEVVPAAKRVLDEASRKLQAGATTLTDYLEVRKDYNGTVQKYRDALVRHRRAMLDLNTDVGLRILP